MADSRTAEFLKEHGFETLIEVFSENEIDYEALLELNNDSAKDLIPKVGPRLKFLKKLSMFQQLEKMEIVTSCPSTASTESVSSDTVSEKQENRSLPVIEQPSVVLVDDPTLYDVVYNSPQEVSPRVCNTDKLKNVYEFSSHRQMAFCGSSSVEKKMALSSYNLDLKLYLEQTAHGKYILKVFQNEKKLNKKTRELLVELLINGAIQQEISLLPSDFQMLADKICTLFPNESRDTYYIPRITPKHHFKNKSINPKGKLIDKYRNLKKKLCIKKKRDDDSLLDCAAQSENSDSIEWLKNWSEPWDLVLQHWSETFSLRRSSRVGTVQQFLEDWPILKNRKSFELIEYDFNKMFENKSNALFVKWDTFFSKLLTLKPNTVDKNADILFGYLTMELDENSRRSIELMLLSILLPPRGRIKSWKPSIIECTESIINHVRIPGDLDKCVAARKTNATRSVQPYLIVVGTEITKIQTCYVVIDETIYPATSVMQGFDILFKMFHVLCIEYPPESEHIWLLAQKGIYEITSKWDKQIPYISTIMNDLF